MFRQVKLPLTVFGFSLAWEMAIPPLKNSNRVQTYSVDEIEISIPTIQPNEAFLEEASFLKSSTLQRNPGKLNKVK